MIALYEFYRVDPRVLNQLMKSVRVSRSTHEPDEEVQEQKKKILKKGVKKVIQQTVEEK